MTDLRKCCSEECLSTVPWYFLYPLSASFHLRIAYRKVKNSLTGVNKLVEKVSYIMQNFLRPAKLITSLKVSHLCNWHNY